MKKIKAFTLAEVLITLTILGVVAAITVPSLQKMNYKRTQVTRMAKAYAALENAATNIATNTNCIGKDLKCTGLLDITDNEALKDKFIELSNFRTTQKNKGQTKFLKSLYCEKHKCESIEERFNYTIFYTTPDNLGYTINSQPDMIGGPGLTFIVFTDKKKAGKSRESVMGRDVFLFTMYGNFQVEPAFTGLGCYLKPLSTATSSDISKYLDKYCNPDMHTVAGGCFLDGANCSSKIIKDGWKMKY